MKAFYLCEITKLCNDQGKVFFSSLLSTPVLCNNSFVLLFIRRILFVFNAAFIFIFREVNCANFRLYMQRRHCCYDFTDKTHLQIRVPKVALPGSKFWIIFFINVAVFFTIKLKRVKRVLERGSQMTKWKSFDLKSLTAIRNFLQIIKSILETSLNIF